MDSVDKLMEQDIDIWLGSHPSLYHNGTLLKREKMLAEPNGKNPFLVEKTEWLTYLKKLRQSFEDIIEIDSK